MALCDISGSMSDKNLEDSKKAIRAFIEKMGHDDLTGLTFFNERSFPIQQPTANKMSLKLALHLPLQGGGTALYDAIILAIKNLGKLDRNGYRRAVLAFTDGGDTASSSSLEDVLALASSASIPIFTVGIGNADTAVLGQIAKESKGLFYGASSSTSLETIFSSIAHLLRGSYLLSYETDAVKGDSVEVEVTASIDEAKRVAQFYGTYTAK